MIERLGKAIVLQPALCCALALSVFLGLFWTPSLPSDRFDLSRPVCVTGRIADSPAVEHRPDQIAFELEPADVNQDGKCLKIDEHISVYISSSSSRPEQWFDPPLQFGERVRFRARLREPTRYEVPGVIDQRWTRWTRGVYFSAGLKSPLQLERLASDSSLSVLLLKPVFGYLADFRASCRRFLSRPVGDLLAAAMIGDRRAVSIEEWDRFERLSLVHLLVVSGFHVGLLAWFLGFPFLRRWSGGSVPVLIMLWVFAAASGGAPPVRRAVLVLTLLETGAVMGLRNRLFNILGAAAFVLLLESPRSLYSASFQYTFLSVLAILSVAPLLQVLESTSRGASDIGGGRILVRRLPAQRYRRMLRYRLEAWFRFVPTRLVRFPLIVICRSAAYLMAAATVTASIQLALLPLLLYYTNQWTLSAVPNNVAALPLFTLFFLAGFLFFLVHGTPAAGLVSPAVDFLGRMFLSLLGRLESINLVAYLPSPGSLLLLLCFILLSAGLIGRRLRFWTVCSCPLLLATVLGLRGPETGSLLVTLLDVGQAECIHLRYPDGSDALIDTGGSHFERGNRFLGKRVIGRYLLNEGTRRLSFVLITHPEADHLGALRPLSRIFPPGILFRFAPLPFETPSQRILQQGDEFELAGVRHLIRHPPGDSNAVQANADSIVAELRYGSFSMLLTGDIDAQVERRLLGDVRQVDVLKVAHHGSRSGTSELFLKIVAPRAAVVSAGRENMFGHPSSAVRERLRRNACPLYSTSDLGTLRIETDGEHWSIARFDMDSRRFIPLIEQACAESSKSTAQPVTQGE